MCCQSAGAAPCGPVNLTSDPITRREVLVLSCHVVWRTVTWSPHSRTGCSRRTAANKTRCCCSWSKLREESLTLRPLSVKPVFISEKKYCCTALPSAPSHTRSQRWRDFCVNVSRRLTGAACSRMLGLEGRVVVGLNYCCLIFVKPTQTSFVIFSCLTTNCTSPASLNACWTDSHLRLFMSTTRLS